MQKRYALLFTDIVDSTALNDSLGDTAMAAVWQAHDDGSRALLARWRGREIDRSDGFFLVFDDVADAVAFCVDYHALLDAMKHPLRARAGLHVGTVEVRTNDTSLAPVGKEVEVFGIAKAVTSRFEKLALPGQTLLSADAVQALAGTRWRHICHGHWKLKGVDEPSEVWELADAHHAPLVPPPDGEKAHRVVRINGQWVGLREVPRSLPAERDTFFGRQADLRLLADRFDEGARLVVLHGPGGIGKTRLALRYGWGWLGTYTGGVYFCDLASARGVDGILHAVARGMDVPLGTDPLLQLTHVIAGRGRCLVILDNFEQVAHLASETLGAWLDKATHASLLVTSREGLGLWGEQRIALAALPLSDAVALFHDRARAANSSYATSAASENTMHSLVKLLDGLPLALELAAARSSVLSPQQLLERMGDRFRLLTGHGNRPQRQATLRAAIAWSWDTLSESERSAMEQLSVFEGGFTLAAAQAVLDLTPAVDESPWVVDVIQGLTAKSLVQAATAGRFAILVSIQAYAVDRARCGGSDVSGSNAHRRHWQHFATYDEATAASGHVGDLDNLVVACRRAATAGDTHAAVQCLVAAWAVLHLTGPFKVAAELADHLDAALPSLCARDSAKVRWVRAASSLSMGELDLARNHAMAAESLLGSTSPWRCARACCAHWAKSRGFSEIQPWPPCTSAPLAGMHKQAATTCSFAKCSMQRVHWRPIVGKWTLRANASSKPSTLQRLQETCAGKADCSGTWHFCI